MIVLIATERASLAPSFQKMCATSGAQKNCPVRLTEMTWFHYASDISVGEASRCGPALLTSIRSDPTRIDGALPGALAHRFPRYVGANSNGTTAAVPDPPHNVGGRLGAFGIVHHDANAGRAETKRHRPADPRTRSRDQGDPPAQDLRKSAPWKALGCDISHRRQPLRFGKP